jgi:hypothetical protein
MHSRSSKTYLILPEPRQHFQNYFELLLSAERAKLQQAIATAQKPAVEALSNEIEQRIAYLKGAVRMGKLLCLIDAEEAKMKHQILMTERDTLLSICAAKKEAV